MGSSQSKTSLPPDAAINKSYIEENKDPVAAATKDNTVSTVTSAQKKKKKAPPENLKGYTLVEYKCRKKRAKYDRCYQQTHSAFVIGRKLFDKETGDEIDHKSSCEDLFEAYKECIYAGMMRDRKERGLGAAKPESALGDYYFEDGED